MDKSVSLFNNLANTYYVLFNIVAILIAVNCYLIGLSSCNSLKSKNTKYLFICQSTIFITSLKTNLFKLSSITELLDLFIYLI